MKIALDIVIAHRHLLSPREAATLTLAVGREWDRKRARLGDRPLPGASHIELNAAGDISFAEPSAVARADGDLTLSGLLGQLLGIDDQQAPRQPIPGGMLITIAGRLGSMELPSSREEGFRNALLRFADDDPGVLARVYTRVVRARDAVDVELAQAPNAKVRRGPERRHLPPVVAALRRAVRELERQTFEAKVGREARTRHRITKVLGAAAAALLLAATGFLVGSVSIPTPTPEKPVTKVRTEQPLVRSSADASIRPITPARKAKAAPPSAARPRLVRVQQRKRVGNQPHLTFAGGTRGITWSQTSR